MGSVIADLMNDPHYLGMMKKQLASIAVRFAICCGKSRINICYKLFEPKTYKQLSRCVRALQTGICAAI